MPLCATASEFVPEPKEFVPGPKFEIKTQEIQADSFEMHSVLSHPRECDECGQRGYLAVLVWTHKYQLQNKKCCRRCLVKFGKEYPI